jgi:FxsC-like protein
VHRGHVPAISVPPYFFLSYAHTPRHDSGDSGDPDVWVAKLFNDLSGHIMQLTDLPRGANPGFMERRLRSGDHWPSELVQALATCRVFVPLYSRRYFTSQHCGQEWYYFTRRALNHAARVTGPVETIIPAVWVPVDTLRLPAAARSIQVNYGSEAYEVNGFYGLIKLSRFKDAYDEAVYSLAQQIVQAAERSLVQEGMVTEYDSLESAFGEEGRGMSGDQRLRITIVAPQRDGLPDGRLDASPYGQTARDWNPYNSDSVRRPIADHAAALARGLGYRVEVGDLYQHEAELVTSGPPSGPQILIIDPWALMLPRCQQLLQQLDALDTPWVQAVIPWNRDGETVVAQDQLRVALDATIAHKLAEVRVTSWLAGHGVPTLDEFSVVLPRLILTAVKQYLRHAQAYPPAGPVIERPRLSEFVADPPTPLEGSDG